MNAIQPKMLIRTKTVQNPDWNRGRDGEKGFPRSVQVPANVRESAIESLWHRRKISRAQYETASLFRRDYEAIGNGGPRAIDWRKEPVDGGRMMADPLSDRIIRGSARMASAQGKVGERNFRLLALVVGDGRTVEEAGFREARQKQTAYDNLRSSLDDLAQMWGLS